MPIIPEPSSYRDPAGFVFTREGVLYRQINSVYRPHYDQLMGSGLYDSLTGKGWLVKHEEMDRAEEQHPGEWLVRPTPIPFLSYAYEWSFEMMRSAALLTLGIIRESMAHNMILKDATPFNIQFHEGRPVWIDTLSFEIYDESRPWIAYRQFCENFIAPLVIAHFTRQPAQHLLLAHPDGIPLPLASSLLPRKSRFNLHTYLHIHLHARNTGGPGRKNTVSFSRKKLENILTSLEILVDKCRPPQRNGAWDRYYEEVETRGNYLEEKEKLLRAFLPGEKMKRVVDLGANTGYFTRIAAEHAITCVAADADPYCMDELFTGLRNRSVGNLIPMVVDVAQPTPALGFENTERRSFLERIRGADLVMALALVHHLAIVKNLPLERIARLFENICGNRLIIEFVPSSDEKTQVLLQNRENIFPHYTLENFELAFSGHFTIVKKEFIGTSGRVLYLLKKNGIH